MIEQLHGNRKKATCKVYLCFFAVAIAFLLPIQSIKEIIQNNQSYNLFLQDLIRGPTSQSSQIPFQRLVGMLMYSYYRGIWNSTNRRSSYLNSDNGTLQLKSTLNRSKQGDKIHYNLKIRIYDGNYIDDGYYQISLQSNSMLVKQSYSPKKIQFETIGPLIGVRSYGKTLKRQYQKSIFINKIILIIKYQQKLQMEILLSSEYNINVIAKKLSDYSQNLHDLLFSFILTLSNIFSIVGSFILFGTIYKNKSHAEKYSFCSFISGMSWDTFIILWVASLCLDNQIRLAIYIAPVTLSIFKLLFIDSRILYAIYNHHPNGSRLQVYKIQFIILVGTSTLIIALNLHSIFFLIGSLTIIIPQIFKNYKIGYKLKQKLSPFLYFALPRYFIIIYLKIYSQNIFHIKPNYLLAFTCLLIIAGQLALILAQQEYGVRSILPNFMHTSQFRYFINELEPQQLDCSICSLPLKDVLPGFHIKSGQIFNNVVLTPCNHKYHIECLRKWVQKNTKCPTCQQILPPIQNYQ